MQVLLSSNNVRLGHVKLCTCSVSQSGQIHTSSQNEAQSLSAAIVVFLLPTRRDACLQVPSICGPGPCTQTMQAVARSHVLHRILWSDQLPCHTTIPATTIIESRGRRRLHANMSSWFWPESLSCNVVAMFLHTASVGDEYRVIWKTHV